MERPVDEVCMGEVRHPGGPQKLEVREGENGFLRRT